jgi:hypothetical protein
LIQAYQYAWAYVWVLTEASAFYARSQRQACPPEVAIPVGTTLQAFDTGPACLWRGFSSGLLITILFVRSFKLLKIYG